LEEIVVLRIGRSKAEKKRGRGQPPCCRPLFIAGIGKRWDISKTIQQMAALTPG
jgi:hypothetical protein